MPKFSDIKPFIDVGSYPVDIPLGYLERWMNDDNGEVDLDPDFQRGHVWTPEQQSRYIEFLIRGGQSSRILYWNHPAYTGRRQKGCTLPDVLVLVDGKQRLTACLKFLHNEVPAFGHLLREYEDPAWILGPAGIGLRMQVNNLQSRAELLEWYLDLNSGGTVHAKSEIERVRGLLASEKSGSTPS